MAEVFLRMYLPDDAASVYTLDQFYLHRLIPNSGKVLVHHKNNGGGTVSARINSTGFRDHEFALSGDRTAKRIVVYGDHS